MDGLFVTIMAYGSWYGASGVLRFSNPALTCRGVPCGVPRSDAEDGADAVYSLNTVRAQLADFRQAVDPPDPDGPTDPGATDPGPEPAEIRITTKKLKPRELSDLEITWESTAVSSVDVAYRRFWKEGKQKLEGSWVTLASGLTGDAFTWTVPDFDGKKNRVQIRLTGLDDTGAAATEAVSKKRKVKKAKKKKHKK